MAMNQQARRRSLRRRGSYAGATLASVALVAGAAGWLPNQGVEQEIDAEPAAQTQMNLADITTTRTALPNGVDQLIARGPDGKTLVTGSGPTGSKLVVRGVVTNADGSVEVSSSVIPPESAPTVGNAGRKAFVEAVAKGAGAPQSAVDRFRDAPTVKAEAQATSFVNEATGEAVDAKLTADPVVSGLKFESTTCQSQPHGSGFTTGCAEFYTNRNEVDPNYNYGFHLASAYGWGAGGADLMKLAVENEYSYPDVMPNAAPNTTYQFGTCNNVSIGASLQGGSVSISIPICPYRMVPLFCTNGSCHRATWEEANGIGRSTNQSEVRSTAASTPWRLGCYCALGYRFNMYTVWD